MNLSVARSLLRIPAADLRRNDQAPPAAQTRPDSVTVRPEPEVESPSGRT